MSVASVVAIGVQLAPHVKNLYDLTKLWIEKFNNDPNDPELKILWQQMQTNRAMAIAEFEEAAEASLARQANQ